MNGKIINSVKDNSDKKYTYRMQMGKYKRAIDNGFYFEAMLITYAMIEDRMRSFLYYIGAVRNVEDKKLNVAKTKNTLRCLFFGSEENALDKRIDINKLSHKEQIIRTTIEWVINSEGVPDNKYLTVIKKTYEGCLDLDGLCQVLDELDIWKNYRNEVIHSLLNKNVECINVNLRENVEKGMLYARFIDSQVKCLKKNNSIRKEMKIIN